MTSRWNVPSDTVAGQHRARASAGHLVTPASGVMRVILLARASPDQSYPPDGPMERSIRGALAARRRTGAGTVKIRHFSAPMALVRLSGWASDSDDNISQGSRRCDPDSVWFVDLVDPLARVLWGLPESDVSGDELLTSDIVW
jgi:hypothetical protein